MILGVDPGTEKSAYVYLRDGKILHRGILVNAAMLEELDNAPAETTLAIEMVASYGMAVGRDVFETVYWIGRFAERFSRRLGEESVVRIKRNEVKLALLGVSRGTDANIREALIERFSGGQGKAVAVGTSKAHGPLYGISSHVWSALAVAVTCKETRL